MYANISSIEYKKVNSEHSYWLLTLVDDNGVEIGKFGSPRLSDRKNFRIQTFGIMSACNNFDLLTLATDTPSALPITYRQKHYNGGVESIQNSKKETFKLEDDKYVLKRNFNPFYKKDSALDLDANIESIKSGSGVFNILLHGKTFATFFLTGQIYWGLLLGGENPNPEYVKDSENLFHSFIESILKFYHTKDLMKLGGKIDFFPRIQVELNEFGKIISIGNEETGFCLIESDNKYVMTNKNNEKEPVKQKIK